MRAFTCQAKEIRIAYLIEQATKIDLYRELHQLVGQEIDLGFTSQKLPDRELLLYFVSINHSYYKQLTTNQLKGLTQQDIQKLEELNTQKFRSKRLRIFKTTFEQRIKKNKVKLLKCILIYRDNGQ